MLAIVLASSWLMGVGGEPGHAQRPGSDLAVVAPVLECTALLSVDLSKEVGAEVTTKARVIDTAKGRFCQVTGTIAPTIGFEVDLPIATWTQRFLQAGCGGLCGNINASIGNAFGCQPALDGQFVVATSDLGHQGRMGDPGEGAFATDPQKRIDFAYRANHVTALAAKALISAYYGRGPRWSYFSGCSDGGREALMEAQRYPDDFDGISAGDPAMLFQVQNSFYHAWTTAANLRADGTTILVAAKLPILHAAVIGHCDHLDGVKDELLGDPRACRVDSAWVLCPADANDSKDCLTKEEWQAAARLYEGPTDGKGQHFLPGGLEPGSEMQWVFIPRRNGGPGDGRAPGGGGMVHNMAPVVYRSPMPDDAVAARFPFTTEQFARVNDLHALNDATDPNLAPFARHGGRLILYHGWSDSSIAPMISVAYADAVRRQMGPAAEDVMRLFMLPGMGHCGGGDGFSQVDTLTPLMAWVEQGTAPDHVVADQVADRGMGPGGSSPRPRPGERNEPGAPPSGGPLFGGPATGPDGRGGLGEPRQPAPYARASQPALATRAIPPMAVSDIGVPAWYGSALLRSGYQRVFSVRQGQLAGATR